jgi:hypothetical protein
MWDGKPDTKKHQHRFGKLYWSLKSPNWVLLVSCVCLRDGISTLYVDVMFELISVDSTGATTEKSQSQNHPSAEVEKYLVVCSRVSNILTFVQMLQSHGTVLRVHGFMYVQRQRSHVTRPPSQRKRGPRPHIRLQVPLVLQYIAKNQKNENDVRFNCVTI